MVSARNVWMVMGCFFLVPFCSSGKGLPKEFRNFLGYDGEILYDSSNDVIIFGHPSQIHQISSLAKHAQHPLSAHLPSASESTRKTGCLPRAQKRRTSLNSDIYHIGDLKFSIPTRTKDGILKRSVLAECGFLVGLSDFKPFDESERYSDRSEPVELMFRWNNLRAKCQISTNMDGLREGGGEADLLVKPLYMRVQLPSSDQDLDPSRWPKIEMSMAKDVTVTIQDLRDISEDLRGETVREAIGSEIESRIMCIVNSEVTNVLKDLMIGRYRQGLMPK